MSWGAHAPIDTQSADTEAKTFLGDVGTTVGTAGQGVKKWIYVFNDEASTALAAGDVVKRDPSATTEDYYGVLQVAATTATPEPLVVGVAQYAIAAGSYGWVQTYGVGTIKIGTADITADTPLVTGASRAGAVIDFADGLEECVIGHSVAAETTNDTTITGFITLSRP